MAGPAIWLGGNYHLMHHLYPGVPNYRLPAVHRYLEKQGLFHFTKFIHQLSDRFLVLTRIWQPRMLQPTWKTWRSIHTLDIQHFPTKSLLLRTASN